MSRKLFFNTEGIDPKIIEEHGRLISTLSLLEWFLQEAIILIILKRKFDPTQKGDVVLVMFAGVGPYSIVIAKNSRARMVYSNEINKEANKYLAFYHIL